MAMESTEKIIVNRWVQHLQSHLCNIRLSLTESQIVRLHGQFLPLRCILEPLSQGIWGQKWTSSPPKKPKQDKQPSYFFFVLRTENHKQKDGAVTSERMEDSLSDVWQSTRRITFADAI